MGGATTMIARLEVAVVPVSLLPPTATSSSSSSAPLHHHYNYQKIRHTVLSASSNRISPPTLTANCTAPQQRNGVYIVGDFMTSKQDLHVVNSTTTVEQALQMLVENRITGFPVIDDDWELVGLVSDYDLLALDSISGTGKSDAVMFPEADTTWKTFNQVQKLLSKTKGQVVGDVMTPAPVVVLESTNLEDAARVLLETKYRRLPVLDDEGKLVGIITRGNVVRAALQIKRATEMA